MKKIIHILKYLTCKEYRLWTDFCTQKECLDRNMNVIQDNLRLKTYPLFHVEGNDIKKI